MHLVRDVSILAPNFSVEVVRHGRIEPFQVDLNIYRGSLEGFLPCHII